MKQITTLFSLLLMLVLVNGCQSSSGTSAKMDDGLKSLPLAKVEDTVSATGEVEVKLEIHNKSAEGIKVFWVDYDGFKTQWRGIIKPGGVELCDVSFATHVWLITNSKEEPLGIYVLPEKDSKIIYRKKAD